MVGEPRVAYRECPTHETEFNYKHKKQTGGSGQYAHVVGRIKPLPDNSPIPYEFVDEVVGGRIPREYIPACDAGFQRALPKGPLCECEVVNVTSARLVSSSSNRLTRSLTRRLSRRSANSSKL